LGNTEYFEPYTQNIYVRRVLSGEFVLMNMYMVNDLIQRGLWNEDLRLRLIAHNGSVQEFDEIPQDLKELYKTVWEIKQRSVIDMAADRGPYVDQSQSMSIFFAEATAKLLTSMHFHGWKRGLKTGMYYLRTKAAVDAVKVTVDVGRVRAANRVRDATKAIVARQNPEQVAQDPEETPASSSESPFACTSCSG